MAGGFPAWVEGTYQVRSGAYATQAEAEAAARGTAAQVVQTSSSGINVVETGTAQILFQFDGGSRYVFGVMPDVTGVDQPVTWFKGYKYYGGFRYERVGGDNITVVNLIGMEDYVNCVVSQEMSDSWPLEALKAQACAARTYAMHKPNSGRHTADHFDLCNGTVCQAYPGMKLTGSNTLQAARETAGMVSGITARSSTPCTPPATAGPPKTPKMSGTARCPTCGARRHPYAGHDLQPDPQLQLERDLYRRRADGEAARQRALLRPDRGFPGLRDHAHRKCESHHLHRRLGQELDLPEGTGPHLPWACAPSAIR